MPTLSFDTTPEAERVQIQLLRQMPAWRKMELVAQLNATVRTLMWQGLRQRFPDATAVELQKRFAELCLGAALAERAYGLLPHKEAST